MSKEALINRLAEKTGLTKTEAKVSVNNVMEAISEALVAGEDVAFVGFGTFKVKDQPEREGRNPATGQTMKIPAKKVVRFTPGKTLRDAVNG